MAMPAIHPLFDAATWARVIAIHDAESGLRAFLVIDSWARGPAFGGIRRRAYASESEALADALAWMYLRAWLPRIKKPFTEVLRCRA